MTDLQNRVAEEQFGRLPDGDIVTAVTLANVRGMRVRILTYGASIQSVMVRDRAGEFSDVALGHATLAEYLDHPQFVGATVGRVANRLAGGRFILDGCIHTVPPNDGRNALHGGPVGFDKRNWAIIDTTSEPIPSVTLQLISADGDQGFPGELTVTARYEMATTDRATVVNLSNHAYWNLAGEGSASGVMDHELTIFADQYLPTDDSAIPTGEMRPVDGTAFDFRTATTIGSRIRDADEPQLAIGRGYDHNWVAGEAISAEVRLLARVCHRPSGRAMELRSNQPGLQFYSGNFLDGRSVGKSRHFHRMGDAFVLEPQMFPDTPNQPAFGSLRLEPGETYRNIIQFRFLTTEGALT